MAISQFIRQYTPAMEVLLKFNCRPRGSTKKRNSGLHHTSPTKKYRRVSRLEKADLIGCDNFFRCEEAPTTEATRKRRHIPRCPTGSRSFRMRIMAPQVPLNLWK